MLGTLIPIVGPSGAGKDTLIDAARLARPDIHIPERVITRPSDAVGEVFRGVEPSFFQEMVAKDRFAFHWQAHGLFYGIPVEIIAALQAGQHVMFNGSRGIISEIRARFAAVKIVVVTAPQAVLASRLEARGREGSEDVIQRLKRATYAAPNGPDVVVVQTNKSREAAQTEFLAVLPPAMLTADIV